MKYFLTSHISKENEMCLNNDNNFVDKLKEVVGLGPIVCLCVSSKPDDILGSEYYGNLCRERFENSGIAFSEYINIHNGTFRDFDKFMDEADLIFLNGGHVPTQNNFIHKLGLKNKIEKYSGVFIGLSAGSMNAAKVVYAMPEKEGEAIDSRYERFLDGLGLTNKMIIPHYYKGMEEETLDGLNLFQDILIPDNKNKEFYIFPDGTYIYGDGKNEEIYGDFKVLKNGKFIYDYNTNSKESE